MTKLPFAVLAGCALFCAVPDPASATPPDITDIIETPFGLSETHLFVLRGSTDNLGLYDSLRVETFLVAIDLKTGEEQSWLVDRAERRMEYDQAGNPLEHVVKRDEGISLVNPLEVLAERGGFAWSAITPTLVKPERAETQTAYSLTYAGGLTFQIEKEAIARRFERVTTFMAENVADRSRMSTMTRRRVFAERFVSAEDCKPGNVLESAAMRTFPSYQIVRIDCTRDIDDGITAFISVWPAVENEAGPND
ncbi:MAG: hypothetical protein AAGE86_03530 [Pseudomonadota bacterium]